MIRNKNTQKNRLFYNENKNSGFTLIELLIYVALVSIFLTGAVYFAWDIIYGRVKARVQQDISQNLRLATLRINYEIRNANDITSVGADNICLDTEDYGPMNIYVSSGSLMLGWGTSCATPDTELSLTSDVITVSDLSFQDLSVGDSKNIKYSITIEADGPSQEWQGSETYETSVELRSN